VHTERLNDPGIRSIYVLREKEEREEIEGFIRYALQARSASEALREATNEQDKETVNR
jgi:hypothetical protein